MPVFYPTIVDEAQLCEEHGQQFKKSRKVGNPLILCINSIADLTNRFADVKGQALSEPGIHITFPQRDPESLDILSKVHGIGMLDFAENMRPMDRPDGYDEIITPEESFSEQVGETITEGEGETETCGLGESRKRGLAYGQSWNQGESWGHTDGSSQSHGTSAGSQSGESSGHGRTDDPTSHPLHFSDKWDRSQSQSSSVNQGSEQNSSDNVGGSMTAGGTRTANREAGQSSSYSKALTKNRSIARASSSGHSTSFKHTFLSRTREEWYSYGLKTLVADQFWQLQKHIRNQGVGECTISVKNLPTVFVKVHEVPPPFGGLKRVRTLYVERFIAFIQAHHPCFFIPKELPCRPKKDNRLRS